MGVTHGIDPNGAASAGRAMQSQGAQLNQLMTRINNIYNAAGIVGGAAGVGATSEKIVSWGKYVYGKAEAFKPGVQRVPVYRMATVRANTGFTSMTHMVMRSTTRTVTEKYTAYRTQKVRVPDGWNERPRYETRTFWSRKFKAGAQRRARYKWVNQRYVSHRTRHAVYTWKPQRYVYKTTRHARYRYVRERKFSHWNYRAVYGWKYRNVRRYRWVNRYGWKTERYHYPQRVATYGWKTRRHVSWQRRAVRSSYRYWGRSSYYDWRYRRWRSRWGWKTGYRTTHKWVPVTRYQRYWGRTGTRTVWKTGYRRRWAYLGKQRQYYWQRQRYWGRTGTRREAAYKWQWTRKFSHWHYKKHYATRHVKRFSHWRYKNHYATKRVRRVSHYEWRHKERYRAGSIRTRRYKWQNARVPYTATRTRKVTEHYLAPVTTRVPIYRTYRKQILQRYDYRNVAVARADAGALGLDRARQQANERAAAAADGGSFAPIRNSSPHRPGLNQRPPSSSAPLPHSTATPGAAPIDARVQGAQNLLSSIASLADDAKERSGYTNPWKRGTRDNVVSVADLRVMAENQNGRYSATDAGRARLLLQMIAQDPAIASRLALKQDNDIPEQKPFAQYSYDGRRYINVPGPGGGQFTIGGDIRPELVSILLAVQNGSIPDDQPWANGPKLNQKELSALQWAWSSNFSSGEATPAQEDWNAYLQGDPNYVRYDQINKLSGWSLVAAIGTAAEITEVLRALRGLRPGQALTAGISAREADQIAAILNRRVRPSDSIWNIPGPAPRGVAAEGAYLDNVGGVRWGPNNFKTIDQFADGIATSIKSIDTRLPSKLEPGALNQQLRADIRAVANFNGAGTGVNRITPDMIEHRRLVVVLEPDAQTPEQLAEIARARQYATELGVDFQIHYTH